MGVINRGIKNAFRNTIRTVSITFILALAIAMSLVMFLALKTVQAKINSVKSSIGNTITISPAGVRGFEGGGELLTESDISSIFSMSHIKSITKIVNDRFRTDEDTNLKSAIEPGSFGERQQSRSNENMPQNSNMPENFSMPIMVTGTDNLSATTSLNVEKLDFKSGSTFDTNTTESIAIVGTDLANKNNLSVGSTFQAYNADIKVVGIFDGGNTFANSTLIMPLKTLQTLSGQVDQINSLVVQTDSIDTISKVQKSIENKLGDKADVTSQQDTSEEAIKPLENIRTISLYSLVGSLIAGSVIIFLIMIMIVRERRKEIGVLKAIGSSNTKIVAQFISESLVLTLMSSVIGIVMGFIFSNPVLKVMVTSNQSSTVSEGIGRGSGPGGPGGGMMARIGEGFAGMGNTLQNLHAIVGYEIILYGILAAIIIAILGSAIPAFFIAKIRPAEVMRAE